MDTVIPGQGLRTDVGIEAAQDGADGRIWVDARVVARRNEDAVFRILSEVKVSVEVNERHANRPRLVACNPCSCQSLPQRRLLARWEEHSPFLQRIERPNSSTHARSLPHQ